MDSQSQRKSKRAEADWSPFSTRPIWSVVSSRELTKVFGVSLNTINSWHMRDLLPEPVSSPKLIGNRNYYRILSVRSLFENRAETELAWDWIRSQLPEYVQDIKSLSEVETVVNAAYDLMGVEKPLIPANFID